MKTCRSGIPARIDKKDGEKTLYPGNEKERADNYGTYDTEF
jgi:hypothetical protein